METLPLPSLPIRKSDTHKGDYGKVLVIAGSDTMIGAPALVARAAIRAGSGLVRIAVPKELIAPVLTLCPYATAFAWSSSKIKDLLEFADHHECLAVGPGLGTSPAVKRLILELIERHQGPMVFDADALNTLAALEPSEWPKRRNWGNIVMTPHMGEYMRLMQAVMKRGANVALAPDPTKPPLEPSEQAQPARKKARSLVDEDDTPSTADGVTLEIHEEAAGANESGEAGASSAGDSESGKTAAAENAPAAEPDRTPLAELLARGTGSVVVLKGHRTVVTDGNRVAINTTGNPAMATPGSGDALTGIIASLIGQRLSPLDAAVLGVHLHGQAGDLARESFGANSAGLLSSDIIEQVPRAIAARTV